jgi:hypothetical protein
VELLPKKPIEKLMKKPMDRREFLLHVGVGTVTLVGISGLVKNLLHFTGHPQRSSGYGSSPYGGGSERR